MKKNTVEFLVLCGLIVAMVVYRWHSGASYVFVDLLFSLVFVVLAYFYFFKFKGK